MKKLQNDRKKREEKKIREEDAKRYAEETARRNAELREAKKLGIRYPVSITIKCECCGEDFTTAQNCYTQERAQNYEKWVRENVSICPQCCFKLRRTHAFLADDMYRLPRITVGTPEQIAVAEKRRWDLAFEHVARLESVGTRAIANELKSLICRSTRELCEDGIHFRLASAEFDNRRNIAIATLFTSRFGFDAYPFVSFFLSDADEILKCLSGQIIDFSKVVPELQEVYLEPRYK